MSINLQAGQLQNRVRFERRGPPVSDGAGNQVTTWEPFCERYAQVKAVPVTATSAEVIIQGRLSGTAIMTVTVRYDHLTKQIAPDDRAVDIETGDILNIRSAVDFDGDRRWLTIDCQKGVAT